MDKPVIHLSTGKTGPGYTGNCKVTKCEWWICDKPGNENLTTEDENKVTCPKCLEKIGGGD